VLRSELSIRLGRGCAVGGGADSTELVASSDLFVVLLTKRMPTDINALHDIWTALQYNLPIVTVAVVDGAGYDFQEAATIFSDLPKALEEAEPGSLQELKERLPDCIDVAGVGKTIHASLAAIIAIAWSPLSSKNHMNSVLTDVLEHMKKQKAKTVHRLTRISAERKVRFSKENSSFNSKRDTGTRSTGSRDSGDKQSERKCSADMGHFSERKCSGEAQQRSPHRSPSIRLPFPFRRTASGGSEASPLGGSTLNLRALERIGRSAQAAQAAERKAATSHQSSCLEFAVQRVSNNDGQP